MKTPEEIKNGLGFCAEHYSNVCLECPYNGYGYGSSNCSMCISRMIKDALAYIQQMEQRLVEIDKTSPRWISVKEREPEPFVSVLGYIPNNDPFPPVRECFRVCVGEADAYYFPALAEHEDITHWMEIPEPPKEDV